MSWRKDLFEKGKPYRVRKSFVCGRTRFDANELLTFQQDYYSHYDGASVFEFRSLPTGELKEWWLYDSEPAERSADCFARLPANERQERPGE